jgi:ABC-type xylose transport system permease subunit
VLGLVAITLAADGRVALSTGSVLGIGSGILAASTAVVRRRARWWALEITASAALGVALVIGVDEVELWSIPAALVALTLGLAVRRTDETLSSWITIAPACVLALVPSLAVGLAGSHQGLRLSAVSALATLVLLEGARRREKGPTVVAVATLATVLVWMIAPHVHQAPSWTVLVTCGAVLLWIGFTWEARRDSARHTWQRWAQWR